MTIWCCALSCRSNVSEANDLDSGGGHFTALPYTAESSCYRPLGTALDASDAITDAIIVLLYHRRAWPLFAASVIKQQESILLRPHNGSLTLDLSFTLSHVEVIIGIAQLEGPKLSLRLILYSFAFYRLRTRFQLIADSFCKSKFHKHERRNVANKLELSRTLTTTMGNHFLVPIFSVKGYTYD
ncbi:hypothetical protein WN944_024095 [Citrus x changshan-huyou]|uniref:Uncharacterized protein n=1 Tax=Citrus x changshan-huyou TaxID=2935761 RepID=A0AAP0LN93_9ROSI